MKKLRSPLIIILLLLTLGAGGGTAYFIVTSGGQTVSTGNLNKGLIAHYPLSSESMKSSTVFADTTMHGYDGTITAGASEGLVTDQHGQAEGAYDFDGANTKIDTGSDWIGTQAITVSAWIYANSYGEGDFGSIVHNDQLYLRIQSANSNIRFSSNGGINAISSAVNSIQLNTWYHVVATRNSASPALANLYINGVLSGNANQNTGTASVGTNVIIGNNNTQIQTFHGSISDVRIYNRILSTDEITQLYQSYRPKLNVDCAAVIDSDGQWYDAVKIGSQCWMKNNLNAGTKIDDPGAAAILAACTGHVGEVVDIGGLSAYCTAADQASLQRNGAGGVTQKYCYDNTEANCTAEGGLYEWQEAMDLAANCAYTDCSGSITTPHQGICPDGWHIPTDTEWKTLEGELGMTTEQQDATGWRGTDEGDKLKVIDKCYNDVNCNSSGFSALLPGYRVRNGGFSYRGSYLYGWSASQTSATYAWRRVLSSSFATVYRVTYPKPYGFSVRCLKD